LSSEQGMSLVLAYEVPGLDYDFSPVQVRLPLFYLHYCLVPRLPGGCDSHSRLRWHSY
jgi:hypothetical protein